MSFNSISILLSATIFLSACITSSGETEAGKACMHLCEEKVAEVDLSNGPCLSNEIAKDWVCDVAHSPRQDADNLPENQCSAYIEGRSEHFVELDLNCNLIRKY